MSIINNIENMSLKMAVNSPVTMLYRNTVYEKRLNSRLFGWYAYKYINEPMALIMY